MQEGAAARGGGGRGERHNVRECTAAKGCRY